MRSGWVWVVHDEDVDVVLRQDVGDVAEQLRAVERLDLDADDVGAGRVVVPVDLDHPVGLAAAGSSRWRSRCGGPTRRGRG